MATCKFGCVALAFRTMDTGILDVLASAIQAAIDTLSLFRAALAVKYEVLEFMLKPLQEAYDAINAKIEEERNKLNLVPPEYILQCPELGLLQQYLQRIIDLLLEQLDKYYDRIRNLLSLQIELAQTLALLDLLIAFLQDILDCIRFAQAEVST